MRFSVIVTFSVLLATSAAAQESTGSMEACRPDRAAPRVVFSGSVADPSGAPVAGANVALRCGNFRVDGRTSGDGTYRISAPAGSYVVEVNAAGFEFPTSATPLRFYR